MGPRRRRSRAHVPRLCPRQGRAPAGDEASAKDGAAAPKPWLGPRPPHPRPRPMVAAGQRVGPLPRLTMVVAPASRGGPRPHAPGRGCTVVGRPRRRGDEPPRRRGQGRSRPPGRTRAHLGRRVGAAAGGPRFELPRSRPTPSGPRPRARAGQAARTPPRVGRAHAARAPPRLPGGCGICC
jgi:hypothetical protein